MLDQQPVILKLINTNAGLKYVDQGFGFSFLEVFPCRASLTKQK